MPVKRAIIAFCIDVDCCSGWLMNGDGKLPDATTLSRGLFGANVGLKRLLQFFEAEGIPATWNIPAHTIESFPDKVKEILQSPLDHEIGCHGYCHEAIDALSEEQQRKIFEKSIEVYEKFTGHRPKGYIAPSWQASDILIRLLEDYGFEYDHSLMAHDCQPHWAFDCGDRFLPTDYTKDPEAWMVPMKKLKLSDKIVEIPGSWNRTDFAAFNFVPSAPNSHGYVAPAVLEQNWKDMVTTWNETEEESFVFSTTIHPQSSGQAHVLAMLKRFVAWLKTHDNVEFLTCAQIADEFKSGKLKGATITGGV